jgi:hypothetical protein
MPGEYIPSHACSDGMNKMTNDKPVNIALLEANANEDGKLVSSFKYFFSFFSGNLVDKNLFPFWERKQDKKKVENYVKLCFLWDVRWKANKT